MPHKATAALAAVLFFGGASVVWADDNSQINGSFAQQPVAILSNSRTAVNEAAKPFTTEEGPLLAPSQRDGTTGRTTARGAIRASASASRALVAPPRGTTRASASI